MSTRIFVGNISYATSERELRDLFQPYDVTDAAVVFDPRTNESRGFGYVSIEDSTKAILDLDGQVVDGRKLHLEVARPLETRE
jgi:RNA recognition motif-containing protein